MSYIVVIPARYQSSRLPAKPLADIAGKPMIEHVYRQAMRSGADKVVVATDDQRIFDVVKGFGGEVVMTAATHESGTERLAEVCQLLALPDDTIVVNVQGDEPLIPPEVIDQVASLLENNQAPMATLAAPIYSEADLHDPNVVKVISNALGQAQYFSRSAIPFCRDQEPNDFTYTRHIGIYAYRAGFIGQYIKLAVSPLEQLEKLEQLRVLWHGHAINVAQALVVPPHGVDTPEDLAKVRDILQN